MLSKAANGQCTKMIVLLFSCILPLLLAGCTPIVTINLPASGDIFSAGEEINFEGQAAYRIFDNDAYVWTSDIDGQIGTGPTLSSTDLSEGQHIITLTITNPRGRTGESSISITVNNGGTTTTTTTIASGQRLVNNNNGTVTDTRTGLVWLKDADPDGTKILDVAKAYCSSLASGQAGLTDGSVAGQWRLPTIAELEGIGTDPPAIWVSGQSPTLWTAPPAPFVNIRDDYYWSSTTYPDVADSDRTALVNTGYVGWDIKTYKHYVWPVRDGN
jgi:hypothetical protein